MRKHPLSPLILTCAALFICSCSPNLPSPIEQAGTGQVGRTMSTFTLASPAFPSGGLIPNQYSCEDADQSPELSWSGAPANTRSFALIVTDPDSPSGTWTHWLIWNIPGDATTLPTGTPKLARLPNGAFQGRNDFHRLGYAGPCPPPGNAHRYFFTLYAASAVLKLKPGASRADLEAALNPLTLAHTQYQGTFQRH
ncbi:MAG TPA: YbhB/YbcL family Raf kinase inhibitor-like protein [Acidobacteriaceae bacterium]|jgi:hypothetical protein